MNGRDKNGKNHSSDRDLNWTFSYVPEQDVFPEVMSGTLLPQTEWHGWEEPYKTNFADYVRTQQGKDASLYAVRDALGATDNITSLPPEWQSSVKLHSACLPLAEFAATVGNLRAARFGKAPAWRNTALFGALDEYRHTQIPLLLMHECVRVSEQFDWTHKFYHSKNWVSIAARHLMDEMLLFSNPVEFALATNFVFETGFTNLQFIGLSALSRSVKDHMFEKMIKSIQTDEARHAQIGPAVLEIMMKHDPDYVQYILDKWFWRSWHLFAILTGFSMDYFIPVQHRQRSFKEFMEEWVIDQYLSSLERYGLKKPWYWETFLNSMETYHHHVYLSAYTYRTTVWFDFVMPGEKERKWLREKYPKSWDKFDSGWSRIAEQWETQKTEFDFSVHGTCIIGFCNLCQLVLCEGEEKNSSRVVQYGDQKYIFCSEPCQWIFEQEKERYGETKDLVKKVLAGEAPGNLLAMLTQHFGLNRKTWGRELKNKDTN